MRNQFAIQLIEQSGKETTDSLFADQHAGVFWVDWREADEDIINMAAQALETQELSSKWQDDKLYVCYKNKMTLVPLMFEPGEQDKTLFALNTALFPDYEIRYIRASEGGETIAFMALDRGTWKALESTYGKNVEGAFTGITSGSPLFS